MEIQKILSYNVYGTDSGVKPYQYVCDLLMQRIDPPSEAPSQLDCHGKHVYVSPRTRAVTCIDQSTAATITVFEPLNEIPFALERFCDEIQFLRNGSTAVRMAFLDAFVTDALDVSRAELQRELEEIFKLKNLQQIPLCISHTFRMKLIGAFAEVGSDLFEQPEKIRELIDPNKHFMSFGSTIDI